MSDKKDKKNTKESAVKKVSEKSTAKEEEDIKAELARIELITIINKKIENLNRHIDNVRAACRLLGQRLIER